MPNRSTPPGGSTGALAHRVRKLRTAADNTASQQVAQKIGGISEGVLRNAWIARTQTEDGSWTDIRTDLIVWSLLPEDLEDLSEPVADGGGHAAFPDWG